MATGGGTAAGRRPGGQPPIPDIDEIVRKGQEQLRILMGGGRTGGGRAGPRRRRGRRHRRRGLAARRRGAWSALWLFMSFYTVRPEEQSVELTFGECRGDCIGEPGLNFAPWPVVTREIVQVTGERTEEIGSGTLRGASAGLMLTGDENIVDITFQTVWNVRDPAQFLFNLSDPTATIQAVAESAMREVVSRSDLSPILSRDRGVISQEVQDLIQSTLDDYGSGVNIVRVNFLQGRSARAGDRRLPRGPGRAAGALDAAEPRRRLRQRDASPPRAASRRSCCRRPRATAPSR